MPWTYWLPPLAGALMNGALAIFLLMRRNRPGTVALAGYLLAITEWSLGYFFQLRGATLADRVFWSKVQYLGVLCVPLFGLVFLLQYLGLRKWLSVRRLIILCIVPAAAQVVVWTNEYHGLIWPKVWLDVSGPFPMMDRTHGLGFWVLFVWGYGLVLVSIFLLITMLIRSQYLYRGQAAVLLIGCLTPVVANIFYTFNARLLGHLDLTVFGFSVTGLSMVWGLFRFRLPDIMPVARKLVFESMSDGVLVLDAQRNIVDMNREAAAIFGVRETQLIGRPAAEVFEPYPEFRNLCAATDQASTEATIFRGGMARNFEVKLTPVEELRETAGRILVLHDITVRKRAEDQLREAHADLERRVEERTTDLTLTIEELREAQVQLGLAAFYDSLTGLPNRRMFLDTLSRRLTEWRTNPAVRFAVMYLDIDRFKIYNDGHGHDLGDQLLIEFSQRLQSCFRPIDTVARIGGDEFTVLLAEVTNLAEVESFAQACLKALASPSEAGGGRWHLSVSIGIAISDDFYATAEEVVREADLAMYHAKQHPECRFAVFDSSMRSSALLRLELDQDLRRALERREFVIHYQPIVSLRSDAVVGFEALIRWMHPRRGMLMPSSFLTAAEDAGVLADIEEWLLEEVCRQIAAWKAILSELDEFPFVSLNLSACHFRSPQRLWNKLDALLEEFQIDPACMRVEILESILISNASSGEDFLGGLHIRGLRIDLDDFGTGYSSLSYLARFPVRSLKIDRSFIADMMNDSRALSIVRAIVTLARSLNIDVIAEGVELSSQYELLRSLGCGYAQGFFFSAPVDPESALAPLPRRARPRLSATS